MRFMMPLIVKYVNDLNAFIKKEILSSESNTSRKYDMTELLSRLETDIISSIAFGLEVNTLEDSNNKLYRFGTTFKICNVFCADCFMESKYLQWNTNNISEM